MLWLREVAGAFVHSRRAGPPPHCRHPADDASVPHDDAFPAAFRGLSVRLEDDVLITDGEPVVLSVKAPKEVVDVEEACQSLADRS